LDRRAASARKALLIAGPCRSPANVHFVYLERACSALRRFVSHRCHTRAANGPPKRPVLLRFVAQSGVGPNRSGVCLSAAACLAGCFRGDEQRPLRGRAEEGSHGDDRLGARVERAVDVAVHRLVDRRVPTSRVRLRRSSAEVNGGGATRCRRQVTLPSPYVSVVGSRRVAVRTYLLRGIRSLVRGFTTSFGGFVSRLVLPS
jgi:hypothetical protein